MRPVQVITVGRHEQIKLNERVPDQDLLTAHLVNRPRLRFPTVGVTTSPTRGIASLAMSFEVDTTTSDVGSNDIFPHWTVQREKTKYHLSQISSL